MIRGITFDKQLMQSADHAHEVNYYYNGDLGVTKGCTVTENVDGNLVVSSGYFIVKGRLIAIDGSEIITVPSVASGTLYSTLVFEIDLTQENTITEFNQGSFKIVSSAVAYPTLIQQDLDNGGTLYQFEFVRFENTVGGIVGLTDTRVLLDLNKYAPTANPTFTGTQTLPNIVTNGIKFPATQLPSADPNTLDDYEEGTWTPTIIGGTTAGVGTYTTQGGHYTKTGNFVHCDMVIAISAHTGTGDMKISGLPFSTKNVGSYRAIANIGYVSSISVTVGSIITGRCLANSSEILLEMIKDGTLSGVLQMDSAFTMYASIDYLTN